MKKIMIFMVAAIAALSLAACAPTKVKVKQSTEVQEIPEQVQAETGGAFDKVPDPNAEPAAAVIVYTVDSNGKLVSNMDSVTELTAQSLMDKLAELKVIDASVKVKSFDITGAEVGPGVKSEDSKNSDGKKATLDLETQLKAGSAAGDKMNDAIEQTFIENFELNELKITVNGK